ncbi:MAG: MFS transporter, partial [Pontixanthobacter sp.]
MAFAAPTESPTINAGHETGGPGLYGWLVFGIIFLLGFLDFAVRQMVVGIFPLLKEDWGLDDKSIGALAAIVPIAVGLSVIPLSLLIDRWSRVKAIFLMAIAWSLATIACGLATSFPQLMAARLVVGLGEAAYGPAGFALIAFYFPPRLRATAISGILIGATLGNVVGIASGGVLAERFGWQNSFIGVGLVCLIVSFAILLVKDYPTQPVSRSHEEKASPRTIVKALLGSPSALYCYLGGAMQLSVIAILFTWLASFFNRAHLMAVSEAAMLAAVTVMLGAIGSVIWGRAADFWGSRDPNGRLYVPAIGALLSAILLSCAFATGATGTLQIALIMGGSFVATASLG